MATISFESVSKVYANGVSAVSDLSLDIADGEFMVLVGPSGCGKTTALRMVAGLEDISSGVIRIGGKIVNSVSPRDRDVAMVFQQYALYPHMTVAKNIGFGLKLRHAPNIPAKIRQVAETLGLTDVLDRRPGQLSGGQQQRVAMGRAMVREPAVFLMDEPLSNLDAKLRTEMRAEVMRLQRQLGVATLYVTHDQVEAMTMGDRVAVMSDGVLHQCDRPQAIYDAPRNLFVASFIGSPSMNTYHGRLASTPEGLTASIGRQSLRLQGLPPERASALKRHADREIVVGIRPEGLSVSKGRADKRDVLAARVTLIEALGAEKLLHFILPAGEDDRDLLKGQPPWGLNGAAVLPEAGGGLPGIARVPPEVELAPGQATCLEVNIGKMHFFEPATGEALR
ncbi:MAG TPA: ATP-binding cassette domain-containing protein [Acidobacteriaceae bacterium]|nr:ATP-binding cassette domain-containing protein [Acidobacteriaceae bacterium]